ncbi:MAG: aminopeptidase P family protein [Hyphomicrobiales bacterium]|nr:aminopeptidase P family protein [Hyphomicrobiales bacterium]
MPLKFESRFQSFAETSDPARSGPRLAALRKELDQRKLHGFIVPRADEHQNEYVPAAAERLAWLTGFTGSAGVAVVLTDKAAIFVDGRYTVQAREQVDTKLFSPQDLVAAPPSRWLAENVAKGDRIGYDPWLHTPAQAEGLRRAVENAGAELVAVDGNPVDAVWTDRPAEPAAPVVLHADRLAGEKAPAKLARIADAIGKRDALLISDPHAVAWAFNIRGGDVSHTPLPLAWALIPRAGRPQIFVAAAKLSNSVRVALEDLADVREPAALEAALNELAREKNRVLFDSATAPEKLVALYREAGGAADVASDPVALMKAKKNAGELRGARAAHLRDGAAIVEFLAWFAREAPTGKLTEISTAQALETFRRATGKLAEISFPTISAFGPHAALPHYRVTEKSNARIAKGNVYLVDSGAQYADGTTDITRTIAVGRPTAEMRAKNTRVLKGHISIATSVFPRGTTGAQLDSFARRALWDVGTDFDHGTGHGVGAYLSVHEGPQRISKLGAIPLEAGMILSNEPGYYREGAFGIRIENLIVVEKRRIEGAEREMLGFETITFAPIDSALIDAKLLTREEIAWLDAYHREVWEKLEAKVSPDARKWLRAATRRLA